MPGVVCRRLQRILKHAGCKHPLPRPVSYLCDNFHNFLRFSNIELRCARMLILCTFLVNQVNHFDEINKSVITRGAGMIQHTAVKWYERRGDTESNVKTK